jgi:hypothetical protein
MSKKSIIVLIYLNHKLLHLINVWCMNNNCDQIYGPAVQGLPPATGYGYSMWQFSDIKAMDYMFLFALHCTSIRIYGCLTSPEQSIRNGIICNILYCIITSSYKITEHKHCIILVDYYANQSHKQKISNTAF